VATLKLFQHESAKQFFGVIHIDGLETITSESRRKLVLQLRCLKVLRALDDEEWGTLNAKAATLKQLPLGATPSLEEESKIVAEIIAIVDDALVSEHEGLIGVHPTVIPYEEMWGEARLIEVVLSSGDRGFFMEKLPALEWLLSEAKAEAILEEEAALLRKKVERSHLRKKPLGHPHADTATILFFRSIGSVSERFCARLTTFDRECSYHESFIELHDGLMSCYASRKLGWGQFTPLIQIAQLASKQFFPLVKMGREVIVDAAWGNKISVLYLGNLQIDSRVRRPNGSTSSLGDPGDHREDFDPGEGVEKDVSDHSDTLRVWSPVQNIPDVKGGLLGDEYDIFEGEAKKPN